MGERTVHLDGREITITETRVGVSDIRLDPSNPRIQFQLDTALTDAPPSQSALGLALTVGNDQYQKLKDSIEVNGGVLNPIWLVREDALYVVIEGNTRLQVYLDLSQKYVNDDRWKSIPAYLLPERCTRDQVNFIRLEAHLFGTTPWDAYEKARELYKLSTEQDYSIERLATLTKLSASDIRSHIQAFRDMKEHYLEVYGEPGEHQKFSYFVEFRKNGDLKRLVKEGRLSLVDFCEWVGEGKFRRGEDIRRLGPVLREPAAREALIDFDFETALDQLAQVDPGARSPLFEKIEEVIEGIKAMPFSETDEIRRGQAVRKVELLEDLAASVTAFLETVRGN
jgi:hypothetical protein